jgi:bifunctional DNase/RNase
MIEVVVNGIFLTQSNANGIILKEKNGERTLPIVIGEYEAQAIALGLENIKPPRPITHDLALSLLDSCGAEMDSVEITELKNNTYFAVIRLRNEIRSWEIDARPSDAIALAVRTTIPIFVHEDVMNVGSYTQDSEELQAHKTTTPNRVTTELEKLREDLQKAVENEEYEKAADLRDRIRKIETRS